MTHHQVSHEHGQQVSLPNIHPQNKTNRTTKLITLYALFRTWTVVGDAQQPYKVAPSGAWLGKKAGVRLLKMVGHLFLSIHPVCSGIQCASHTAASKCFLIQHSRRMPWNHTLWSTLSRSEQTQESCKPVSESTDRLTVAIVCCEKFHIVS